MCVGPFPLLGLCCWTVLLGSAGLYCLAVPLDHSVWLYCCPNCLAVLPDSHRQRRKVSEMVHFLGLNVGKVAKLKLAPKTRPSENSLTCMFTKLVMVCGNKLQLFRHLGLHIAGFWAIRGSWWSGMSLDREYVGRFGLCGASVGPECR